jgi:hypothetical protein
MKYEISIGQRFNYVEFGTEKRLPVEVVNIFYDGFMFLIEYKHEDSGEIGCTQYPEKLKRRGEKCLS